LLAVRWLKPTMKLMRDVSYAFSNSQL
jgi:hypothetical protein